MGQKRIKAISFCITLEKADELQGKQATTHTIFQMAYMQAAI